MKAKLATQLYHGKDGYNCAQAILKAFQDEFTVPQLCIANAKLKGRGKADGGICGALYAAHKLIKEKNLILHINTDFKRKGGSIVCKEIRQKKLLSCKECVKLAAENIQKLL